MNLKKSLWLLAALSLVFSSICLAGPPPTGTTANPELNPSPGVVNINTASEDQLKLLPGVGPAKAQAIIKYRARQAFRNSYDLVRVKGIGRKMYLKLRALISVAGPTTLLTKPKLVARN